MLETHFRAASGLLLAMNRAICFGSTLDCAECLSMGSASLLRGFDLVDFRVYLGGSVELGSWDDVMSKKRDVKKL